MCVRCILLRSHGPQPVGFEVRLTNHAITEANVSRQPPGTLLKRALRLRCPRCGGGRLFVGYFRMYAHCPNCNLKYEQAPGYFLGATYINYGLTASLLTMLYIGLHYGVGYDNRTLALPLASVCIAFPLMLFRFARSLWLAMDCYFDSTRFETDEQLRPPTD